MAETKQLTNRALTKMHVALATLGNRRMANLNADLKVGRLLRAIEPHIEALNDAKRKAAVDLLGERSLDTLTKEQREQFDFQCAQANTELDTTEVEEIELPMAYVLKEADLPRELPGKDGAANASQIGAIVADLGLLFIWEEDE